MVLEPAEGQVTIHEYARGRLEAATEEYLRAEQEIRDKPGAEAVLVRAGSIAALKRAYPNYFLDTRVFRESVRRAITQP